MQFKDDRNGAMFPYFTPTPQEVSKQLRINQEIVMKEISEYIDKELERFRNEVQKIKEEK